MASTANVGNNVDKPWSTIAIGSASLEQGKGKLCAKEKPTSQSQTSLQKLTVLHGPQMAVPTRDGLLYVESPEAAPKR